MFHGDDGTVWQSGYALMSVMKNFQVPVRSVQPGDRVLIITDDAMDPLVWQGAMAAINEKGGEPVLCMWPRLDRTATKIPGSAAARWRSV
jgi:hypothetical protein